MNLKHNEGNGEENRDGTNDNDSWNCGAEGTTDDSEILALRSRQMKNMLAILLTSRGIPMILPGDEFANTQFGNNNAYCQDNDISWLDWSCLEKNREHYDYVRSTIAFRMAHPVLRNMQYEFGHNGTGYPELSFHGTEPWQLDENAGTLVFAYMYAEDHAKFKTRQDCFIYITVNAHWGPHTFNLPIIPKGFAWHLAFDTNGFSSESGKEKPVKGFSSVEVEARTVKVLLAKRKGR